MTGYLVALLVGAALGALGAAAIAALGDLQTSRLKPSDPTSLDRMTRRFDDVDWLGEWPPITSNHTPTEVH